MAVSPSISKESHHGRSLSLPSNLQTSTCTQFDSILSDVRDSDATCSSLPSISDRLNGLTNLCHNIDDLLLLPHNQKIISHESQEKWVDRVLDGYIRLLDDCTTAKDLFTQKKHDVQHLLSALRRKDVVNGIDCYLTSSKKSKKMIKKSVKDLRSFKSKQNSVRSFEKDHETTSLMNLLQESESVAISLLESIFSYMVGSKSQSRKSGWSLVPNLMHPKNVEGTKLNEFEKVDEFLKTSQEKSTNIEELTSQLKEMNLCIQTIEQELDFLFRQLIKTRVVLLNILNQ